MQKKVLGSGLKIRVSKVSGNTQFNFRPMFKSLEVRRILLHLKKGINNLTPGTNHSYLSSNHLYLGKNDDMKIGINNL